MRCDLEGVKRKGISVNRRGGQLRIGISGWRYAPWRGGNFYPEDLPQHGELTFASRQMNTIEINGTFYSLQRPSSFQAWYEATPEGFVFAVKGGRFITHLKRLKDVRAPLANFFASGVLRLREKLGPILWQLPPSFRYDRSRLETFFKLLPRDMAAAQALAGRHDSRLRGRVSVRTDYRGTIRHALEVRHRSFEDPDFVALLREHDIGLVVADTAGKWPWMEDVTSDFVYVRLHGDEELYVSGYTPAALREWARKIRAWAKGGNPAKARMVAAPMKERKRGREVFVYFDNDVKVHAPFDAMELARRVGLGGTRLRRGEMREIREGPRARWPEVKRVA
jgi:uncharacterized protein YecE (DUF72 family)